MRPDPSSGAVDVVIVNYDGGEPLLAAVASATAELPVVGETVVVDNGSAPEELAELRRRAPDVRVIANRRNRGFAGGCNQGILATRAPYICLLNNDAWVLPGTIAKLCEALDARPDLAAVQAVVLRADGRGIDTAGIEWNDRGEAIPIAAGRPAAPWAGVEEVPGVSATVAVYRRRALTDVTRDDATFPRSFFAYYEDVDLSLRLLRSGWRLACHGSAPAYHHGSLTGARTPWRRSRLTAANRWRTLGRNFVPAFLAARIDGLLRADLAHARALGARGAVLLARIAPLVAVALTPKRESSPRRLRGFPGREPELGGPR